MIRKQTEYRWRSGFQLLIDVIGALLQKIWVRGSEDTPAIGRSYFERLLCLLLAAVKRVGAD